MTVTQSAFEIFLVGAPGHEGILADEARACRFAKVRVVPGGVTLKGTWPEVWRANLELRGAVRVLARIGGFRSEQLGDLEGLARKLPWAKVLRPDVPFQVEATCRQSRIFHSGAAAERFERAIKEQIGAPLSADAEVCIRVRIENDFCVVSVDTSGEPLYKRGHKQEVAKAPLRESLAAMFLRQCGYDGREPVLDPMCGSGTFVIEAAEIAAGLKPGRSRGFAFQQLATFRETSWVKIRDRGVRDVDQPAIRFHGSDRDAGAIRMSRANAKRAGVSDTTEWQQCEIAELIAPAGPPGLVIVNPPYGARIADKRKLHQLYRTLGETLATRFAGWRVGLVTSDRQLAAATGLPVKTPSAPVMHGGFRVALYQTGPLA